MVGQRFKSVTCRLATHLPKPTFFKMEFQSPTGMSKTLFSEYERLKLQQVESRTVEHRQRHYGKLIVCDAFNCKDREE